jgi:hypothetical protein
LLGFSLGLLQSLLLLCWVLLQQQWPFSWVAFLVLGILVSLAIPALDGFLAARQNEDTSSGFGPGCLVGGIGFLIIAALTSLLIPLVLQSQCAPPGSCNWGGAILASAAAGELVSLFLVIEGIAGVVFGLLGGWLGGLLGSRRAAASQSSGGDD